MSPTSLRLIGISISRPTFRMSCLLYHQQDRAEKKTTMEKIQDQVGQWGSTDELPFSRRIVSRLELDSSWFLERLFSSHCLSVIARLLCHHSLPSATRIGTACRQLFLQEQRGQNLWRWRMRCLSSVWFWHHWCLLDPTLCVLDASASQWRCQHQRQHLWWIYHSNWR